MDKTARAVETATKQLRPTIAGEHYLSSETVCAMLHISKRTLQSLRDTKAIPYTSVCGHYLYPESGLYKVLEKNYRDFKAWNK